MTEKSAQVSTALDLKQFLSTIPEGVLERLPLSFISEDGMLSFSINDVEAYELTETQGCIERGFRFTGTPE